MNTRIKQAGWFVAVSLLLFIGSVYAQRIENNYRFVHITPREGLPHSLVFSIFQDY